RDHSEQTTRLLAALNLPASRVTWVVPTDTWRELQVMAAMARLPASLLPRGYELADGAPTTADSRRFASRRALAQARGSGRRREGWLGRRPPAARSRAAVHVSLLEQIRLRAPAG